VVWYDSERAYEDVAAELQLPATVVCPRSNSRKWAPSSTARLRFPLLEVSGDIVERVDPVFYSDPMTAAMKALGMT
jgi:hypothetical protein